MATCVPPCTQPNILNNIKNTRAQLYDIRNQGVIYAESRSQCFLVSMDHVVMTYAC